MLRVLVVDDTPSMRRRIMHYLETTLSGYEVITAGTTAEALRQLEQGRPNVVLLDLVMPPRAGAKAEDASEGLAVLRAVREGHPHVKVIVLSSRGDLAREVLVEEGADDFFWKDNEEDWLGHKLCCQLDQLVGYLVCRSEAMQRLRESLAGVDLLQNTFFVWGEEGAGRRRLASILHRCSAKGHLQRVELACGALSRERLGFELLGARGERERLGLLDRTDVGAVVLHEVERLSEDAQQELGEVLRQHADRAATTPRLVLTALDSPDHLHAEGRLSPTLARQVAPRLGGRVPVFHMPPLNGRKKDIAPLARLFAAQAAVAARRSPPQIDPACLPLLENYHWEVNGAQLRGMIENGVKALEPDEDTLTAEQLGLELPLEYRVTYGLEGEVARENISRASLPRFTDPANFELIVFREDPETEELRVLVDGREVSLTDSRHRDLVLLLMRRAGERVPVKNHKRALGVAPSEHMKRYVFELRRALGDTTLTGRASRFICGHYGEEYSLNMAARFCLVERLGASNASEKPESLDS